MLHPTNVNLSVEHLAIVGDFLIHHTAVEPTVGSNHREGFLSSNGIASVTELNRSRTQAGWYNLNVPARAILCRYRS